MVPFNPIRCFNVLILVLFNIYNYFFSIFILVLCNTDKLVLEICIVELPNFDDWLNDCSCPTAPLKGFKLQFLNVILGNYFWGKWLYVICINTIYIICNCYTCGNCKFTLYLYVLCIIDFRSSNSAIKCYPFNSIILFKYSSIITFHFFKW